jgi:hypothetical protein
MLNELLERLSKITNVKERIPGERLFKSAMAKDALVGLWWYQPPSGKLEYSEEATTHLDSRRFTLLPDSRGWVRGRVFKDGGKGYVTAYLEDWLENDIPGKAIADIVEKISQKATISIVGVVDEEGRLI